jgi:D-alanyl-D-alanine carboxypeptidase (penicillin-binding protein 5/6)
LLKKICLFICSCFLVANITPNYNKIDTVYADNTASVCMEVSSLRVLDGVNYNKKMPMASTTKILTAICIIENVNLDAKVTVTKDTVGIQGSSIYLEVGEILSVKDLLYGLMLRSGNDCAVTLAKYCSGSVEKFVDLMNITAKNIGAFDSNFVNPHGLHDDNHYTTAYDLALISCYALKNTVFREIVSTKQVTIPHTTRDYSRILINKNKMLSLYDGCTGIKTGFTKKAGRCLVSSAIKNGMEVVSVVLNCPDMWVKSKNNLDNSFAKYNLYKIIEADNVIDFIDIDGYNEKCGVYVKNDVILPLTKTEYDNLKIEYDYPKNIKNPFSKDSYIGQIKIYSQNNLLFCEKIYTIIGKK